MLTRIRKLIRTLENDSLLTPLLYKYHCDNEYLSELISGNKLFLGNPLDFNDPFDCNLTVNNDLTPADVEKYFRSNRWVTKLDKDELIKQIYDSNYTDMLVFEKRFRQEYLDAVSSIGVTCFTQDKSNLLLWAHYSNKHTGLCLEFDSSSDTNFFNLMKKVKYTKEYPVFRYLKYKTVVLHNLFLKKSAHWKYEQEIRVIKTKCDNYEFDPYSLKAVYFGIRSTDIFINKVKGLLTAHGKYEHVKLYKAELKEHNYGLDFIAIR